MKNFETAQSIIQALQDEVQQLKNQIYLLTNKTQEIGLNQESKVNILKRDAEAAMRRFTDNVRKEIRNSKKESNGK